MSEENFSEDVNAAITMARNGDPTGLAYWLASGGDPDAVGSDGWTPLLAAAARGKAKVVDLLLNHEVKTAKHANPNVRFAGAGALPIYMAGQAGDVETVRLLLMAVPSHIHEICPVNGHTVLLQASFFGREAHLELAIYLLENVCRILSLPDDWLEEEQRKLLTVTNVRGLTPVAMARYWNILPMVDLLNRYPQPAEGDPEKYLDGLLLSLAEPQALTERMMRELEAWQTKAAAMDGPSDTTEAQELIVRAKEALDMIINLPVFDINRLGGPLYQTPLIFAITGMDSNDVGAKMRYELVRLLLDRSADPTVVEKHPMAIGAVIRASVLNQFAILRLLAEYLTPDVFTAEMNKSPAVNGLTALHDAVHRALSAAPETLDTHIHQITWMIERGARTDIPSHDGQTQLQMAITASNDSAFSKENVNRVRGALGLQALS